MVSYRRSRYKCSCGESEYPFDHALEISRSKVSKRLAKIGSEILIFVPLAHAKKMINNTLGINISETLLGSIYQRIGVKLYNELENKSRHPETAQSKTESGNIMYIEADGSMVPTKGEKGIEFKENKIGIVFTDADIVQEISKTGKEHTEIEHKRFVNSIGEGTEKFKKMLYALAKENGLHRMSKQILLCDGAAWLSKMKDEYFPDAIQILDWYHAVEHLWQTAHLLFGENEKEKCKSWVEPLKELLWNGKVAEVIEILSEQGLSLKKNQEPIWKLRGYFTSNMENMRYDKYRAAGYYIGSGAIESANKYIVADRLKRAGMRWDIENANSLIWLRSKYFEDDWEQFWDTMNISDWLCSQKSNWGEEKKAA